MGYFALPLGDTWQESLDSLKANVELLKQSPECDYLFDFMQTCLTKAKKQYQIEHNLDENLSKKVEDFKG